jgi:hypothetical protein
MLAEAVTGGQKKAHSDRFEQNERTNSNLIGLPRGHVRLQGRVLQGAKVGWKLSPAGRRGRAWVARAGSFPLAGVV